MTDPTGDSRNTASNDSWTGAGRRWVIKMLARTHVRLNELSGGRLANKMQGHDVCFVTMTGAVSGRKRTKPLMYVPFNGGVLLVASIGGAPQNPTWFGNIMKHPEIQVRHRGKTMDLNARLAQADERSELWPICDAAFPPYADYRTKTDREIPILVCEPRVDAS
jgi:F420H(2)-dependent quinone reductase